MAQNLQEVVAAVEAWRSDTAPLDLEADGRVTKALQQIGYHHLLGDSSGAVEQTLGDVGRAVDYWTDTLADKIADVASETGTARDDSGWPGSLLPSHPYLLLGVPKSAGSRSPGVPPIRQREQTPRKMIWASSASPTGGSGSRQGLAPARHSTSMTWPQRRQTKWWCQRSAAS